MYKIADSIPPCPLIYALDVVSPKWTVEILRELAMHSVRTRAFLKVIPGLSMKSLAQRLHALQSAGLISRQAFGERELHVEYTITPRGRKALILLTEFITLGSEMLGVPISCRCSISGACESELDCPRRQFSNAPLPAKSESQAPQAVPCVSKDATPEQDNFDAGRDGSI